MFEELLANVRTKTPIVHCITNYVTVNDCANIVLAAGGSPIMADDLAEVEDITSISSALVINIGTLNARTIQSMIAAGQKANALQIPVILDPVGAGASKLRDQTVAELLAKVQFAVIRGNISEIKAVALGRGTTKGVDADAADQLNESNQADVIAFAKKLSLDTGAVIAITGKEDLITNGTDCYLIRNGHPMMSKITGSGCMLTCVIGCYLGANADPLTAASAAVCAMGLCGELAYHEAIGTASFRTALIDAMSLLTPEQLTGGAQVERL